MWYLMGVVLTAGGAFSWYQEQLARELAGVSDAAARLDAEAASVPRGAEGVTFLPYLQGERTPHRDAAARGAILGLSLAHTRAHLTRAVLEGITFALRDSVTILQALGLAPSHLLLTGGGAKSALLRRLQGEIFGLPVTTVNREEGPAYGAALLAAVGAGAFPDLRAAVDARRSRVRRSTFPIRSAHEEYAQPYARFRALVPRRAPRSAAAWLTPPRTSAPRSRASAFVRRLLASQETGLVIVVTLLTIALIALAGSHLDRRTGLEVNNFWNANTHRADAHRRELLRDHGGRRDDGDHQRRDRSLRRIDLRAGRRHDGARVRVDGPMSSGGTAIVGDRRLRRDRSAVRAAQRHPRRRAARAPVHRHARHDVGAARHRVRREQGGEHPRAVGAHRGDEGAARTRRRPVSGADARR